MALDRTRPRADIAYLRRRPRPGELSPPAATTAAPAVSLDLRRAAVQAAPRPVPRLTDRSVLGRDRPVVVLDRLQSAVGGLVWDLVGDSVFLACAWELGDGTSGIVREGAGRAGPTFDRVPVVELAGPRRVVIALRQVRRLRRLLLIAEGTADRLVGELHTGARVETAPSPGRPVLAVLAAYSVEGELVLRREDAPFGSHEKACAAYGFSADWLPPL